MKRRRKKYEQILEDDNSDVSECEIVGIPTENDNVSEDSETDREESEPIGGAVANLNPLILSSTVPSPTVSLVVGYGEGAGENPRVDKSKYVDE